MLSTTTSAVLLAGSVLARPAAPAVSRLFMVRSLDFCVRAQEAGPLERHHFTGTAAAEGGQAPELAVS